MISSKATLLGVCAILIWSTFTAVIRTLTESFGVTLGTALMYSVGAVFLCLQNRGIPNIKKFSKAYLLVCGPILVIYEIVLSQAIGLAVSRQQSIEVSLINYLWPCLIVLFAIFINKQKVNPFFWLGLGLSFMGVMGAVSGDHGFDLMGFITRIKSGPLPYLLAFLAALLWGLYCNLSKRFSNGHNGIPLFFIAIAVLLWIKFLIGSEQVVAVNYTAIIELLVVGILIACSYAFWETGIQKGNMLLLAILSYFAPVSSVLFSAVWLQTTLSMSFWYGVIMVVVGSVFCWLATRNDQVAH